MAHGYLREYDEGWDRDRDTERRGRTQRDRSFMIGDRGRDYGDEDDRGQDERPEEFHSSRWTGRGRGGFSAHPDDHYRSWRDKQMAALDRDYKDYCREREQQFHRDFDDWRSRRRSNPEPLQTGMTQTGLSADPSGMTQAESEMAPASASEPDPMADATLGTNSRGRGRG